MPELVMFVYFVLGTVFSGVIMVAALLYIRHTWKQLRSGDGGSIEHRILDEIERLQMSLEITNERLRGVEQAMKALPGGDAGASGDAGEDPGGSGQARAEDAR